MKKQMNDVQTMTTFINNNSSGGDGHGDNDNDVEYQITTLSSCPKRTPLPKPRQQQQHQQQNSNNTITRYIIDTIQSIRVPVLIVQCYRNLVRRQILYRHGERYGGTTTTVVTDDDDDDASNNNNIVDVYCISGLEKVFLQFPGESFVDAPVVLFGIVQPPRYIWYMISGLCCDIIQFIITVLLHYCFYINNNTTCWTIGFILSIIFRHTFHRYLVFGNYVGGYYNSLQRMYGAYSIIIILSTIFNAIVTSMFASISFTVVFILTLSWTGIANYFILKKIWSFTGSTSTSTTTVTN